MQLNNPIQMNDWKISKFIQLVLIFQILFILLVVSGEYGLNIPVIKELISIFYLCFIPGILIIRILKLHQLGNIKTLLFAVGLSLSSLMFLGFFMNMVYPALGILNPLSLIPLITTISIFVLISCVLSYIRDRSFSDPQYIDTKDFLSPSFLFLCLIPFLAIIGTYLMNFYGNNILLIILIISISLIAILVAFDKIPKNLYAFAVFIISISLLYHISLISPYLSGYDIQIEQYLANLVINGSYWDFTFAYNYNAMISVTILAPIFSKISGMTVTWVLKITYPILFSLVPLGLYKIFKDQTNSKIAFLACFFFMSFNIFFIELPALARQEIAELFLILLILLIIDKMDVNKRIFLLMIFGISLVVSHYSLTYFYLFLLICTLILLFLVDLMKKRKPFKLIKSSFYSGFINSNKKISLFYIILLIIFMLSWYFFISSSTIFNVSSYVLFFLVGKLGVIVLKAQNLLTFSIILLFLILILIISLVLAKNKLKNKELLKLNRKYHILNKLNVYSDKLIIITFLLILISILINKPNLLYFIGDNLIWMSLLFIFMGISLKILKPIKTKFKSEFVVFALISFIIMIVGLIAPSFSSQLNMSRVYNMTFIFLSPFCVIGGIKFFEVIIRLFSKNRVQTIYNNAIRIFSIFLVIFLLFNTGVVNNNSIALNKELDSPTFNEQEYISATWLIEKEYNKLIWVDSYGQLLFTNFIGYSLLIGSNKVYPLNMGNLQNDNNYIFLRKYNIENNAVLTLSNGSFYESLNGKFENKNKIYENGGSDIYF